MLILQNLIGYAPMPQVPFRNEELLTTTKRKLRYIMLILLFKNQSLNIYIFPFSLHKSVREQVFNNNKEI